MEGQIGVLYQNGNQVAGVYDWEVSLAFDSTVRKGWEEVKSIKHITSMSYWLVEKPQGNLYDIELYQKVEGQLILMDKGTIAINLPDTETLDRRLYAPLNLIWKNPSEY
uniref:Uncharacterized protein n=2 Tax=viral metagenome TaxID=1070528 RepID=A0A6M3JSP0_9ZZZZ